MVVDTTTRVRSGAGLAVPSSRRSAGSGRAGSILPAGTNLRFAPGENVVRERRPLAEPTGEDTLPDAPASPAREISRAKAAARRRMAWNIMEDDTLLLAIMVGICLLGIGYVAKYAQVAMQGRQIHALQVQLASETARQHTLINEIGQLESPNRIAVAAQKMGMVMGDKADYVTVRSAPKSTITASSTPAFGVTSPSLGIGSIGDN